MKTLSNALLCAGLLASAGLLTTPAIVAAQGAMPGMPMPAAGAPAAKAPITAERPASDVALDAVRKPMQMMAFAGVKPGMTIAELGAGGGYYTRLLSKAVGPKGKIYTIYSRAQAARAGGLDNARALAAVLGNVEVLTTDFPAFVTPTKVDLVWTTENYHDFHNGPTANIPALDKAVFDALKPGGIFYVEDHSAAVGAGLAVTSTLHRMDEAVAKAELMAAGFQLVAESDLLRNSADTRLTKNAENGHFTTDRFSLKLKKPG